MPRNRWWIAALDSVAEERRAPRQTWVELTCLLCGEMVGILLDHRVIRPRTAGSIRIGDQTMRCGRCGGPVLTGERGDDALRDRGGPGRPAIYDRAG